VLLLLLLMMMMMTLITTWLCLKDVEVKQSVSQGLHSQQSSSTYFAFVQFDNIASVVSSLREMDGELLGTNKMKV